jgi:hypothetical protein
VDPGAAQALDDVESFCWRDPLREIAPEDLAFPSMRAALQVLRKRLTTSS